ncbi:MAG: hypothetical protein ACYC1W_11555, partial [Gemmatimonadaceae bacterium]
MPRSAGAGRASAGRGGSPADESALPGLGPAAAVHVAPGRADDGAVWPEERWVAAARARSADGMASASCTMRTDQLSPASSTSS